MKNFLAQIFFMQIVFGIYSLICVYISVCVCVCLPCLSVFHLPPQYHCVWHFHNLTFESLTQKCSSFLEANLISGQNILSPHPHAARCASCPWGTLLSLLRLPNNNKKKTRRSNDCSRQADLKRLKDPLLCAKLFFFPLLLLFFLLKLSLFSCRICYCVFFFFYILLMRLSQQYETS